MDTFTTIMGTREFVIVEKNLSFSIIFLDGYDKLQNVYSVCRPQLTQEQQDRKLLLLPMTSSNSGLMQSHIRK